MNKKKRSQPHVGSQPLRQPLDPSSVQPVKRSRTGKASPCKPSKHDVLAQVYHLVYYLEDYVLEVPGGSKCKPDLSVLRTKCRQVKQMLDDVSEEG